LLVDLKKIMNNEKLPKTKTKGRGVKTVKLNLMKFQQHWSSNKLPNIV
jgi:hypothetical protein